MCRRVSVSDVRGAIADDLTPEELVKRNFMHMGRSVMEIIKILFCFLRETSLRMTAVQSRLTEGVRQEFDLELWILNWR